jgi:hypothetical protein
MSKSVLAVYAEFFDMVGVEGGCERLAGADQAPHLGFAGSNRSGVRRCGRGGW